MSRHTKFKNLLFNPGLSLNLEDDTENSGGRIVEALEGPEGVAGSGVKGISTLRARNARRLADSDQNYEDEKVQRADLKDDSATGDYDPSLAKYFLMEDSSDEDEANHNKSNVEGNKSKSTKVDKSNRSLGLKKKVISSDNSEESSVEDDGEAEKDSEEEIEHATDEDDENESAGFSFTDGDYSQYADDFDEDDGESESSGEDEEEQSRMTVDDFDCADSEDSDAVVEAAREKLRKKKLLKKKQSNRSKNDESRENSDTNESTEDDSENDGSENDDSGVVDEEEEMDITAVKSKNMSEEQKKAEAVTKQFDLYDKLFECRILQQKVVSSSHNLPQPDVYPAFKRIQGFEGERYQKSLRAAIESSQALLESMLKLQESLCLSTEDTATVLTDGSVRNNKPPPDDDDEEITSSEDEQEENGKDERAEAKPDSTPEQASKNGANKRKRTDREILEETEETLAKRHRNMKPYRNKVVAYWEERTKLLQTHNKNTSRKGGSFEAFEESFSVMVARLLNDRDKVLRRTQLRSANRGNFSTPIGGVEEKPKVEIDPELDIPKVDDSGVLFQRYDPEIYDDTDFYSFALEQVIKTKMMRGTSSLTTAEFLDFTHKLRKKNKKIVDTKRSKGRKLKYDVHSSLLQFLAPRGAPEMEDEAIDVVVHSLFGGQKHSGANVQPAPA